VLATWNAAQGRGVPPVPAMHEAMDQVLTTQAEKISRSEEHTSELQSLYRYL
jgi:hypothetical protein